MQVLSVSFYFLRRGPKQPHQYSLLETPQIHAPTLMLLTKFHAHI